MAIPKNKISTSTRRAQTIALAFAAFTAAAVLIGCGTKDVASDAIPPAGGIQPTENSTALIADGKQVFRFDTMGDEQLWTDKLRLHEVVEKNVDPTTALKIGLKVDAEVLPAGLLGKVDLKSPATTVALLKMNAIVGIQAEVDANNHITKIGVTCALCHSTVDNSVMPGIGHRQDGWPEPGFECRGYHCAIPRSVCGQKGRLQFVGVRQV